MTGVGAAAAKEMEDDDNDEDEDIDDEDLTEKLESACGGMPVPGRSGEDPRVMSPMVGELDRLDNDHDVITGAGGTTAGAPLTEVDEASDVTDVEDEACPLAAEEGATGWTAEAVACAGGIVVATLADD